MAKVANAQSGLLNTDSNPVLRWLVKRSLYKQFCAGETPKEVRATMDQLRQMGYKGVILGYAKEIVLDKSAASGLGRQEEMLEASERSIEEIESWRKGTLDTVKLAAEGDYVALKFTGAGMQTIQLLKKSLPPSPSLERAINEICELATTRNVRLLFDAEQQAVQPGIDDWTLEYMRRYNNRQPGKAVVYGTYQAYLKVTPKVLAEHLSFARREGFTLGVKLVRGAYLATDPRYLISDTKEDTDRQYDGIVASLIEQKYNAVLTPNETENGNHFPPVNVVLASHNQASIRRAQEIRRAQSDRGVKKIDLVYAQLMGMADEVSCELLQAGRVEVEKKASDIPKAYKYLVWGTTGECMKYLLRRAEENRDAVARTRHGRDALAKELWRRLRNIVSLL
ncbi:MAG: proline dehydrogenase [Vezdaea acicularis]|nr:MAG: proline dehydrogenase [Vezdaea acicularis]